MNIHIHTQYAENYGTPEAPYWKFKGGQTIVVTGFNHPLTSGIGEAAQAVVSSLRATIEYANEVAEEYIIDWELASVDALTEDERLQMEFDGRISYPAKRMEVHLK